MRAFDINTATQHLDIRAIHTNIATRLSDMQTFVFYMLYLPAYIKYRGANNPFSGGNKVKLTTGIVAMNLETMPYNIFLFIE